MKRIVILGNSITGVQCAVSLRANDQESSISIVALDQFYPSKPSEYACFIANEIKEDEVYFQAPDFYAQNNISVVADKKVTRINFKKKRIFTEEKEHIDYDVLVMTDVVDHKYPDIKGTNKTGVLGLRRFSDIKKLYDILPIVEAISIEGDSLNAVNMALSLVKHGKEVVLIQSEKSIFNTVFPSEEDAQWLKELLQHNGINLIQNNSIEEVLGEGDARAIRLKSGKVYASQVILFEGLTDDMRLLAESGIEHEDKIKVSSFYQANIESVFAADSLCTINKGRFLSEEACQQQGEVIAAKINGQDKEMLWPLASVDIRSDKFSINTIGDVSDGEGVRQLQSFQRETSQFLKLWITDQHLIGAFLVNRADQKDKYAQMITEKQDISQIESEITAQEALVSKDNSLSSNELEKSTVTVSETEDSQDVKT